MILIRANIADQSLFDLRSPLNGYRDYEIFVSRKFDVVDVQSRIGCVAMEVIVVEIK